MLLLVLLLTIHAPKTPYILEYSCDSGWGEIQSDACPETSQAQYDCTKLGDQRDDYEFCTVGTLKRTFPTRQQVIDWLESNYAYWPVRLMHGQTELTCEVNYLDSESLDIWRAHQKEVDCDTRDNLEKRNGKDN